MVASEKNLLLNMKRVRLLEETCAEFYTQEKIRGFLHLYIGEEAVASGVMSQLTNEDNVVATYREHGHALLKGISAKSILAEMFGKQEGCSGGRGGSMHLFSYQKRFFGGNAIVAAGIPQAVGIAFAAKKLKENRLTVCFFGEGAMAEGVFYESLNMASLWDIPLLFCCENNLYAMGTSLERSQAQTNLPQKVFAHGVSGSTVDGMNVIDVLEKTKEAIKFIRNEKKPYFLEFKTYRFRPHSMFDPDLYRSKEEVNKWKEKDPISSYTEFLLSNGFMNSEELHSMDVQVKAEMREAIDFAESGKLGPIENLEKDLYADELPRGIKRRT